MLPQRRDSLGRIALFMWHTLAAICPISSNERLTAPLRKMHFPVLYLRANMLWKTRRLSSGTRASVTRLRHTHQGINLLSWK